MNIEEIGSNWITPQALAKELEINPSVVYGWITSAPPKITFKELGQGDNTGKKRYLVDKTTRPPLRGRGRVW